MGIKLIRNFNDGICRPIEDSLILKISNGSKSKGNFSQKNYSIVDVESNSKQEILPEIEKYDVYDLVDLTTLKGYIYFSTIDEISTDAYIQESGELSDTDVKASLMRYSIADGTATSIYESVYPSHELSHQKIQVVVLDESYILVQIQENIHHKADVGRSRLKDIFLYDTVNKTQMQVSDELLSKFGFESMLLIDVNICAIKIGLSNYEYKMFGILDGVCDGEEKIAVINVRQFLSDLVLGKEQLPYEFLAEADYGETFPYMKLAGGYLLYSRADLKQQREELVVWDNVNRISKVRVNDDLSRISKKTQLYLLKDTLYFVQQDSKGTRLINLNTQKIEWRLSNEYKIVTIVNDLVVISRHVTKGFFRKESDYVLVYQYPNVTDYVLKEKSKWTGCMVTANDDLLIFCQ